MTHLAAQFFLNHRLDPEEIRRQTREIAEAGYDAVYAEARPGMLTPFMSNNWWQVIDTMMDVCRDTGLEFWIWDEDYFPSGTAGGRIVWEDPGLLAHEMLFSVHEVESDSEVELDFLGCQLLTAVACRQREDGTLEPPIDLMPWCGTRRQQWKDRRIVHTAYSPHVDPAGNPHWRSSFKDNRFALAWTPPEPGPWIVIAVQAMRHGGDHPDILNPQGTRRYLDYIYEPFHERYAADFGKTLKGSFNDEPNPGASHFPWSRLLPDAFEQDHGYPILDALPHLARDLNEHSPGIRWQFRQTQHRLQRHAYTRQIGDWCEDHGIQFTGHLTRTEWLSLTASWWPNELRFYKDYHIPCADPLGRASAWQEAAAYHTGLKVVSSAAHLFGKEQSGSDCLAVIGEEAGLRDIKSMLDYHLAMGLSYFVLHGLSYSYDGPRKDEVPPSLFYQHSEWPYMHTLMDDIRESCQALTGGEHRCRIAVLYPSTSLGAQVDGTRQDWFKIPDEAAIHDFVDALLSHQRDFDFIDETTLQESVDADGALTTPEDYQILILPHLRCIEAETADALEQLADRYDLVAIGTCPQTIDRQGHQPVAEWETSRLTVLEAATDEWLASLPGPELAGDGARDVFLLQRRKNGQDLTFAYNRAETPFDGTLDGTPLWLPSCGSALFQDGEAVQHPLADTTEALDLSRDWQIAFEPNQAPLPTWHYRLVEEETFYGRDPAYNLLTRETPELPADRQVTRYYARFMVTGDLPKLEIVTEESAVEGDWSVTCNGHPVELELRRVFDCLNLVGDLTPHLRTGSTPTVNIVEFITDGAPLVEMPHLVGRFHCDFRHGQPASLPYLSPDTGEQDLASLRSWADLGYGTFSGTAVYTRSFTIEEAGHYLLDLGRVEDLAAVELDGEPVGTIAWEPYVADFGDLEQGEHTLKLRVANAPGNRTRMYARPAGLLGPVRLMK